MLRRFAMPARMAESAAAVHGAEQRSGSGARLYGGQVRTTENADHHIAVGYKRQRHRVLISAQEALGAVDWVEDPVAAGAASPVVAPIECRHHLVAGQRG